MKLNKSISLSPEKSPFFYLLPVLLFMFVMVAYPILRVLYFSFTQHILTRPDLGVTFVGLQNYVTLFKSTEFWATFSRTALWTGLSVLGKTLIGFLLAWLLAKEIAFKRFYMALLLIPWVTPMVVAAIAWRWVYDGEFGMLNWVLTEVHLLSDHYVWLGHKFSAFVATAVTDMWLGIPFMAMLFLAGLQSIPREILESSDIDGASPSQRLRFIILPLMKPVILVATTLSAIWTFNSFGVIWPLTKGGPVNATTTLVVEAYQRSFGAFDIGMGSAIAIVIFLILLIFTTVYYRALMSREEI
ncbi:carbohydrate ABC transporter membrane protein 1 (CUT1 family) [Melghirimyces profundicolus]|uniref:Carbohydrate ABC transporter membrane protein 1 (CUT1 family) n=1 Tax=Melghirimyces profundicolus TaxID=1242148 RepID=A0A2T6BQX0_9BACL|nr:sugar ABC transporter permease [Melghirimyces profundicolus]PTX58485.1 carbohydrate ABC transporter membrane protein 1 (CUT1 family) [Melghirimyces profundicolus]